MVSITSRVDTAHRGTIHDAQMNYYGTRLATCSSDCLVKIFEVKSSGQTYPVADLCGHDGPVWQVVWAHPKFDSLLASCSYDKRVIIWKEMSNKWQKVYEWNQHEASVNSISWAPEQHGLILACASTDTTVSLLTFIPDTGVWSSAKISNAHVQGCNAVSWAPVTYSVSACQPESRSNVKRIVTGGNDNLVKIWKEEEEGRWIKEKDLEGHGDWVRDVAWAPAIASSVSTIASCGQDRRVLIWRCLNLDTGNWSAILLNMFDDVVWTVSWSLCATILAVCGGDNKVTLWKENLQNSWIRISDEIEDDKKK